MAVAQARQLQTWAQHAKHEHVPTDVLRRKIEQCTALLKHNDLKVKHPAAEAMWHITCLAQDDLPGSLVVYLPGLLPALASCMQARDKQIPGIACSILIRIVQLHGAAAAMVPFLPAIVAGLEACFEVDDMAVQLRAGEALQKLVNLPYAPVSDCVTAKLPDILDRVIAKMQSGSMAQQLQAAKFMQHLIQLTHASVVRSLVAKLPGILDGVMSCLQHRGGELAWVAALVLALIEELPHDEVCSALIVRAERILSLLAKAHAVADPFAKGGIEGALTVVSYLLWTRVAQGPTIVNARLLAILVRVPAGVLIQMPGESVVAAMLALAVAVRHDDPAVRKSAAQLGQTVLRQRALLHVYASAYARLHGGSTEGIRDLATVVVEHAQAEQQRAARGTA